MSLEDNNSSSIKKFIESGSEYTKNRASKNTILNYVISQNRKKFSEKVNPKLKLPPLPKASDNVTFKHEIWSTDTKYNQMKDDLNLLKILLSDEQCEPKSFTNNETNETNESNEDESELDLSIASSLENIITLEDKLKASCLEYEEIKKVRLKEQNEICKVIQSLDTCPFEQRSSQSFHKLCNYKTKDNTNKNILIPINKPKFIIKRRKSIKTNHQKSHDKSKNTQLSTNLSMSTSALTDEEKARIQILLADMNDDGEDNDPSQNAEESQNINFGKAFGFIGDEETRLSEIHDKLTKFDKIEQKDLEKRQDGINYDQINWKEIKELSIKEIDKALNAIHEAETTENTDKPPDDNSQ